MIELPVSNIQVATTPKAPKKFCTKGRVNAPILYLSLIHIFGSRIFGYTVLLSQEKDDPAGDKSIPGFPGEG